MARRPSRAAAAELLTRHRDAPPGGRTVYAVHPGALPVGSWANLAGALSPETGFAVLDLGAIPAYLEAALEPGASDLTVDRLIDILVGAYRTAAPAPGEGPVTFVGWSFGGVIAHGMTERLAPEERPDSVVLLDSIAPTDAYKYAEDDGIDPHLVLRWFAMFLGAKRGREVHTRPLPAGTDVRAGLELVLQDAVAAGALPPGTPPQSMWKLFDAYTAGLLRNNRLTLPYQPARATVPLAQLKAQHSLIPTDPTLGWSELADHAVSAHTVPGDHYTMLIRPDASRAIAGLIPASRPAQLVKTRRDTP
ncbi:thioesterase domain-containing protein [Streptomyces sp. NPDC005551]|uniref:thioesterase domain-containing protein n=1 Tax=unclassified Streptomyces TaxID=2593676 RepID=UPI0033E19FDA